MPVSVFWADPTIPQFLRVADLARLDPIRLVWLPLGLASATSLVKFLNESQQSTHQCALSVSTRQPLTDNIIVGAGCTVA